VFLGRLKQWFGSDDNVARLIHPEQGDAVQGDELGESRLRQMSAHCAKS
jgi:hypothetical protein